MSGLTLDDYLNVMADARRTFQLPPAKLSLRQIVVAPGAKQAIDAILKLTTNRHGSDIYSEPHPLLELDRNEIDGKATKTSIYSDGRIHPDHIAQALLRAIEVGLQTIIQLPSRQPKLPPISKRLKSVASALTRSAEKLNRELSYADVGRRIHLWEEHGGDPACRLHLTTVATGIQWAAEALNALGALKTRTIRLDSPNPQIYMTMVFIGWIEASTGGKQYASLTTLLQATFHAAGRSTPPWVDRLAIEMHRKRRWRKNWSKLISSKGTTPSNPNDQTTAHPEE